MQSCLANLNLLLVWFVLLAYCVEILSLVHSGGLASIAGAQAIDCSEA